MWESIWVENAVRDKLLHLQAWDVRFTRNTQHYVISRLRPRWSWEGWDKTEKKMPPCISASFWSAAATSGWGGWRAQASPPKGTSFSKYPHPSGGCSLHTLGMIQLLLLPSSRLHFIFITSLNPTCSLPTSGFRGANWPNTEEPAVAGRHPFSPFTFELSKFIHLQSEHGDAVPIWFANQKGRGSCSNPQRAALRVWWALSWPLNPWLFVFLDSPLLATCVTVRCGWQLSQEG